MPGIDRLIVGTSGSPVSLAALRYAVGLACAHHAALIPVIAWEPPGGDQDERLACSAPLRQACRDLACRQLRDALVAVWGEKPGDPLVQPQIQRGPAGRVQGEPVLPGPRPVPGPGHPIARTGPRTRAWPPGLGVLAPAADPRA